MKNVHKLFDGTDPRAANFTAELQDFIYERGQGIQFTNILGAIEIVKHNIIIQQMEDIK